MPPSDFVRDTTEYDLRSYSHLVKHLNKITLMKLTITSTLVLIFLLSLGSTFLSAVGTFHQMSACPKPVLSSFHIKLVLSPGSLFQLKVLLLFIQFSRGHPVLPIISLDCPFSLAAATVTTLLRPFPAQLSPICCPHVVPSQDILVIPLLLENLY